LTDGTWAVYTRLITAITVPRTCRSSGRT
jgi:hypothetical protein